MHLNVVLKRWHTLSTNNSWIDLYHFFFITGHNNWWTRSFESVFGWCHCCFYWTKSK